MTYSVDVSEFQRFVDDTYPHPWLSFRLCDGDYLDHKAARNLTWALKSRANGKIVNFTVYVVYRPGKNATILSYLRQQGVPADCVLMVDVESWGGQIHGDRSAEITALVTALRTRQGGRSDLVWCYANRGDFAAVYPHRPAWLPLVVASYGSVRPDNPGPGPMVGWQYTDGQNEYPIPAGAPRSSAPFGPCDHNIVYATPSPLGDDMPLTDADVAKVAAAVWGAAMSREKGQPQYPAGSWLTGAGVHAGLAEQAANQVVSLVKAIPAQAAPALSPDVAAAVTAAVAEAVPKAVAAALANLTLKAQ